MPTIRTEKMVQRNTKPGSRPLRSKGVEKYYCGQRKEQVPCSGEQRYVWPENTGFQNGNMLRLDIHCSLSISFASGFARSNRAISRGNDSWIQTRCWECFFIGWAGLLRPAFMCRFAG